MDVIEIQPVARPFRKTICVPGSKSITNRALVLAALADGTTLLTGVLFADDTWQMIHALQMLGYELRIDQERGTVVIVGRGREVPAHPEGGGGSGIPWGTRGGRFGFRRGW
ncbi:MAG: hypothetical protein FWD61_15660 [Phycisphaerales bacterium]|nr:hypothetical protein [Phycisphaerales bacterium]